MKDVYMMRTWNSSGLNYANSSLHSYLNGSFLDLFDSNVANIIKQIKIPYRNGTNNSQSIASGSNGLSAKIFTLSYAETGFSGDSIYPIEGSVLTYFDGAESSKRIAYYNNKANDWLLRTPVRKLQNFSYVYVGRVTTTGTVSYIEHTFSSGVRPAMVLPQNTIVKNGGLIDGETAATKPTLIGEKSVGDIVTLNVNGAATDFIVIHQGIPDTSIYDSSCDGTWLLMKDIFQNATWDADSSLVFNKSGVYSLLNGDILNAFDASVRSHIKTVKIPYATEISSSGNVATGTNGMTAQLFLLSLTEYGYSKTSYTHTEGAALAYFSDAVAAKRVANLNGTAAIHWTRSMDVRDEYICYVAANGSSSSARDTKSYGVRPALVLSKNVIVKNGGLIDGELYTGNSPARLPSGYTEVEYIGLTGTQYVDTGFKASNTTRVVMDFELTDTSVDNYIFGAYKPSGITAVERYYLWWSKTHNYYTMYTNDAGSSFTGFKEVAGLGRHLLDKNRNNTILDEVSMSVNDSTFTTSYDMYLGTVNSGGTPRSTGMVGKIYSCQIYDNDVLVRDFVPCVNASGVAGLYDLANGVFYGNAGTGVFEAGLA
jgi:hypothetical protein